MADLGARLMLFIGPNVPVPAPYDVMDALVHVEVKNNDKQRDGFQMDFAVGKTGPLNYNLLSSGLLDAPNLVSIMVIFNGLPQMLINGVITQHQFVPSNKPGESMLHVTGEDIGLKFDKEEKNVTWPNMPDFAIVSQIILQNGLLPEVTPTTDVPLEIQRVPTQQGTDLSYIKKLADRNGFVFYTAPTLIPGVSTAYWGPENRLGVPQPALTLNMGPYTNVDTPINFSLNSLGPATPTITIVEPITGTPISIPAPTSLRPPLALRPVPSQRTTIARDVANLSPMDAALKAVSSVTDTADAVTATGTVDAVRYGRALQPRQLVGVRGVGFDYDGFYYVKEVTHLIKPGEYKQSFKLTREGLGSLTPIVIP